LKTYSPAQEKRLAAEFPGLPKEARQTLDDYGLLRREIRAIGAKP
jgi:hypothetical protein